MNILIAADDLADAEGRGAQSVAGLTKALRAAKAAARKGATPMLWADVCEVQWRLSRAHERAWSIATKNGKASVQQQHMRSGLAAARGAVEIADGLRPDGDALSAAAARRLQHLAHKWAAIFVGYETNSAGTKQKLKNLPILLAHAQRASELNAADATCHHTLGQVCFSIASISRTKRALARTLYGAVIPTATYADALRHFQDAERVAAEGGGPAKPMNRVWLSRVFTALGDAGKAKVWAQKVLDLPCGTAEEQRAHKEARVLLKAGHSRL